MIEKISLALMNESGEFLEVENVSHLQMAVKIEIAIADTFAEIRNRINALDDEEIKTAERFNFALNLKNYLKEIKENVCL